MEAPPPNKDEETGPISQEEIVRQQEVRLAMLTAAFIKEVGSSRASQFELVQLEKENVIRWYFRRRKR